MSIVSSARLARRVGVVAAVVLLAVGCSSSDGDGDGAGAATTLANGATGVAGGGGAGVATSLPAGVVLDELSLTDEGRACVEQQLSAAGEAPAAEVEGAVVSDAMGACSRQAVFGEEFAASLAADHPEWTPDQVGCVVDGVVELPDEVFAAVMAAGAANAPLSEEQAAAWSEVFVSCGVEGGVL